MIVSDEARVLFVHVQKTGGLTLERFLVESLPGAARPRGRRHLTLEQVHRQRPELVDYWTFGFVRNPWARLWSWWSMVQRRGAVAAAGSERVAQKIEDRDFWSGVLAYPDFETFVLRGSEEFDRLRRPQLDYLRTPEREADFIGRTETLDADLVTICAHLGLPAPVATERRNAGPGTDYREQFTPVMRDRVAELFAADLQRFGYEF